MKKLIPTFALLFLIASCGNEIPASDNQNKELEEQEAAHEIIPFEKSLFEETYPFSEAEYVEIISYPVRHIWDTTNRDGYTYINDGVIKDGKIRIDKSKIIDRVKLSEGETQGLFEVLYNTECTEVLEMACYDPRHAFIFFDRNNKAFASIEICLDCLNSEVTEGITYFDWCFEKETEVSDYLKSVGVTYFGGGPEEEAY